MHSHLSRQQAVGQVARQYEKWVYPRPVMDLADPVQRAISNGGDPRLMYRLYWPNQTACPVPLNILVAGCGANAAARYAFQNPQCQVTGIDLSSASLAHEAWLKDKHGLENLTLAQCDLESVASLGQTFNLIDVSGVLHHLPDPVAGLRALGSVLHPDGVIYVMLYGRYGRTGVYQLQELFRLLDLGQDESDVAVVKEGLSALKTDHPVQSYLARATDWHDDAGLVDTFLHPQDRPFTVKDCLNLVAEAGLVFQGWQENFYYHPEGQIPPGHPFSQRIAGLPQPRLWEAMELFHGQIAQHCFYITHPARDRQTYEIGFEEGCRFLDYVPVMRANQINPDTNGAPVICRKPFPPVTLDALHAAIYTGIDGCRTVRACLEDSGAPLPPDDLVELGRRFFRGLWRMGYVYMHIPQGA